MPAPAVGSCGKLAEGSVRGAGGHKILRVGDDLYSAGCFLNWAGNRRVVQAQRGQWEAHAERHLHRQGGEGHLLGQAREGLVGPVRDADAGRGQRRARRPQREGQVAAAGPGAR